VHELVAPLWKHSTIPNANVPAAAAIPIASFATRGSTWSVAVMSAAPISGTATGSGTSQFIR